MKQLNQVFEEVSVDELKPHPKNARKANEAELDRSIAENGFFTAVTAQKSTGYILAGKHRWERAKAAGYTSVPVLYVDVDDTAALKIIAADNRTSDLASYDTEAQLALLTAIRDASGTFEGTGYTEEAFEGILQAAGDAVIAASKVEPDPKPQGGESKLSAGFAYRVIVDCESEMHQTEILERFESEGLTCRPLIS